MARDILQCLARVEPVGVRGTHPHDIRQRHNFLKEGKCFVMAAQEIGADVGIVGDHAASLRLLQQAPDHSRAGLKERSNGTGVQDARRIRQRQGGQGPLNVEGVSGRTVGSDPGCRRRGLSHGLGPGQQHHSRALEVRCDGVAPGIPADRRQKTGFHVQPAQTVSNIGRRTAGVFGLAVGRLHDVDQRLAHNDDVEGFRHGGSGGSHAVPVSIGKGLRSVSLMTWGANTAVAD
ncbi:hypothetical protein PJL18_03865 [Paenarthrobacter nicotinovorans]|nr:hypothetical protein [Paenarthrobacter nicotinovorans]